MSGRVVAALPLPTPPQETGTVTWANGETQELPLISADDALRQLAAAGAGDCPKCIPLEVTFAILTTAWIQTSRGPATVPAWEYTLKGTAVRLTRAAVTKTAISRATPTSWHLDYWLSRFITIIVSATTPLPGR
jgi:hypothetical protein